MGLKRAALEKRIAAGERVLIDTSVFVAYLSHATDDETHEVAAVLFEEFIISGRNTAVVSPVTAMELLVRPLRVAPPRAAYVHAFLANTPNLDMPPIELHVAQEAASLRATHRFQTPDALIIATGLVAQVHHLVTNDVQWRAKLTPIRARLTVTLPRDYI
jgi:predicted nucleic acid-binding protein